MITFDIDAAKLADDLLDLSGNQSRADQAAERSEAQRQLDNTWRRNLFYEQKAQLANERVRADNFLTRRAKDAQNAGISLLASMGGGSYSPQNVNMPSGQGGRVAGTYSRRSMFSDVASVQMRYNVDLAKAQIENIDADTYKKLNEIKELSETDQNKAMETQIQMRPQQEVIIEGTRNPTQSSASKTIKQPDGSTMRAPSDNYPDPDQYIFWWLQDKYYRNKALRGTPYHPEFSRSHNREVNRRGRPVKKVPQTFNLD